MRSHESALELFSQHTELAVVTAKTHHKLVTTFPCADLDDAIQVCLMELWRCARHYDAGKGATFTTYASGCMRGRLMDARRVLKRAYPFAELALESIPQNSTDRMPELPDPTDLEGDTIATASVEYFLRCLPEREKQVAHLREEGYSQAEIARHLGVSEVWVGKLVRKIAAQYAQVSCPGQCAGLK